MILCVGVSWYMQPRHMMISRSLNIFVIRDDDCRGAWEASDCSNIDGENPWAWEQVTDLNYYVLR